MGHVDLESEEWLVFRRYIDDLFCDNLTFFGGNNGDNGGLLGHQKKENNLLEIPIYKKQHFSEQSYSSVQVMEEGGFGGGSLGSGDEGRGQGSLISGSSKNDLENPIKKSIPGGRYGFSQFVKHFGPEMLQERSLGR